MVWSVQMSSFTGCRISGKVGKAGRHFPTALQGGTGSNLPVAFDHQPDTGRQPKARSPPPVTYVPFKIRSSACKPLRSPPSASQSVHFLLGKKATLCIKNLLTSAHAQKRTSEPAGMH